MTAASEHDAGARATGGAETAVARFGPPALLVLLAVPILFTGLGRYGLVNGDEGIYHYMARHMLESGDWFSLWFTGEERLYDTFTHAPLYLWVKAVFIAVLGDDYWAMRLPSALLGVASLLATYALVDRVAGRRAAFLAGLVQLTTYQLVYVHAARTGEMETTLTLAFTLAALFFLRAIETGRGFVAHHLCLVVLINTKLAIVLVPVLAEAIWFALSPPARARMRDWISTALWVMPLGALWHFGQAIGRWEALPAILETLGHQSRGAGFYPDAGLFHHLRFYAVQLVSGTFPYVLLYPLAIAAVLLGAGDAVSRRRFELLALYPAAVAAFFLALSIHQPWYLVPALPFLSAFLGIWFDGLLRAVPTPSFVAVLAVALAATAWIRVPMLSFNPFAERAMVAWAAWEWGPGALVAVPILALVLGAALMGLARTGRSAAFAAPVLAALVLVAGVRVVAPLRHLSHVSDSERLRREIDAARATGETLAMPLHVRDPGIYKARFYFGDEFDIRPASPALRQQGVSFVLHEKPPR